MLETGIAIFDIIYFISQLALISAGLAIIFGMMRVINLAHGEFMTLGGYAAIGAHAIGINIYVSILVVAPILVGLFGLVVERLFIRPMYGKLINSMLVTWGLSMAMMGTFSVLFANHITGIETPIGSYTLGEYSLSGYAIFVICMTVVVFLCIWGVLKFTRVGLIARAAMQNPEMAEAFGYNSKQVYMLTFVTGSALTGLAGALMAPLIGISPTVGGNYIAKAFITVISGGTSIVAGTISSSAILGTVNQFFTNTVSPLLGEIALLIVAIIILRLLPQGLSAKFWKNHL